MVKSDPYNTKSIDKMRRMRRHNRKGVAKTVRFTIPKRTASKHFHAFLEYEGISIRCKRNHEPDTTDAKPTRSCCSIVWRQMFLTVCEREWDEGNIVPGSKRESLVFCCYGCMGEFPLERATLGHKKSAFNGGAFEMDNLCLTCEMCEIATGKSDLHYQGWRIYGPTVRVYKKFVEMQITPKYINRIIRNRELIAKIMRDFA